MKRLNYLMLLVLPMLLLAGCTSTADDVDNALVGTWDFDSDKTQVTIQMKNNATMTEAEVRATVLSDLDYKSITFSKSGQFAILFNELTRAADLSSEGQFATENDKLRLDMKSGEEKYVSYTVVNNVLSLTFDMEGDYSDDASVVTVKKVATRFKK